jgi:hypothetical protein
MRLAGIDLFGVYVGPISLIIAGAWLITIAPRRLAGRFGLLRYVPTRNSTIKASQP